jgi:hypothetical protein
LSRRPLAVVPSRGPDHPSRRQDSREIDQSLAFFSEESPP